MLDRHVVMPQPAVNTFSSFLLLFLFNYFFRVFSQYTLSQFLPAIWVSCFAWHHLGHGKVSTCSFWYTWNQPLLHFHLLIMQRCGERVLTAQFCDRLFSLWLKVEKRITRGVYVFFSLVNLAHFVSKHSQEQPTVPGRGIWMTRQVLRPIGNL